MSLILTGNSSTLTVDSTSGITFPNETNQAVAAQTGPAFYAYVGSDQSISSGAFTKIQFNTEVFDTNNNFDSTTNYRFTPTVAGYYQFNICTYYNGSPTRMLLAIYKNGSSYLRVYDGNVGGYISSGSGLVYMNGSTDYVEGYCYVTGTSLAISGNSQYSFFQGFLARAA